MATKLAVMATNIEHELRLRTQTHTNTSMGKRRLAWLCWCLIDPFIVQERLDLFVLVAMVQSLAWPI